MYEERGSYLTFGKRKDFFDIIINVILIHQDVDISTDAPKNRSIDDDYPFEIIPQKLFCAHQAFPVTKYAPWKEELDTVILNLLQGGFDQKIVYGYCEDFSFVLKGRKYVHKH